MTDDDIPPIPTETIRPTDLRWRSVPPTDDEIRRWPYWWWKPSCCEPELLIFSIGDGFEIILDGDPFDRDSYHGLYAPAVPPPHGGPDNTVRSLRGMAARANTARGASREHGARTATTLLGAASMLESLHAELDRVRVILHQYCDCECDHHSECRIGEAISRP